MQAASAAGGLPPGFPSALGGLPPGLGMPPTSMAPGGASSLLAGMPPTSSTAALMHMMAGARLPGPGAPGAPGGLPHPADLYADKEKELAKLSALPGPMSGQSDDRNRTSLSPSRDMDRRAKSPGDRRSPDPKKMKKDEVSIVIYIFGILSTK